jgi:hypothetical protein
MAERYDLDLASDIVRFSDHNTGDSCSEVRFPGQSIVRHIFRCDYSPIDHFFKTPWGTACVSKSWFQIMGMWPINLVHIAVKEEKRFSF